MKSAYLYVRVSTDEQKRKGYPLPEQEDRLLKYCEFNNIDMQRRLDYGATMDIFKNIANMDIADRRHLVKLFPPGSVDLQTGDV